MSNDDENIFFVINDENDGNNIEENDLKNFLDSYNEIYYENQDAYISQKLDYQMNYVVKELLFICNYYGIAKQLKSAKCNKEDIITILVNFEMNPINSEIVMRRKKAWFCLGQLKNDKFFKKYILWSNMHCTT